MNTDIDRSKGREKRLGIDRRKTKPPLISKYLLVGRRSAPRRKNDRLKPQRVDRYSSKIFAIIMVTLGLSILDAIFTLYLVGHGATEINPFMAYYLEKSPSAFMLMKYVLTATSALLILFLKDFTLFKTKIKARVLFYFIPLPFLLVVQWQLFMIFSIQ